MTKPTKSALINEATVDAMIERLTGFLTNRPDGKRIATFLRQCKPRMLGGDLTKAATDFTLEDVITTWNLKYSRQVSLMSHHESQWAIEDELHTPFPITPCLGSHHFLSYHVL